MNAEAKGFRSLDLGLNHHEIEGIAFETKHGQEVGNRFLRLPELSAGDRPKQDQQSDLSFVTGILLYMLTGQDPEVLQAAAVPVVHLHEVGNAVRSSLRQPIVRDDHPASVPTVSLRLPYRRYLQLAQETWEVSDALNVDLDTGSEVIGFDIDHASSRFDQSTLETEAPPLLRSTKVG